MPKNHHKKNQHSDIAAIRVMFLSPPLFCTSAIREQFVKILKCKWIVGQFLSKSKSLSSHYHISPISPSILHILDPGPQSLPVSSFTAGHLRFQTAKFNCSFTDATWSQLTETQSCCWEAIQQTVQMCFPTVLHIVSDFRDIIWPELANGRQWQCTRTLLPRMVKNSLRLIRGHLLAHSHLKMQQDAIHCALILKEGFNIERGSILHKAKRSFDDLYSLNCKPQSQQWFRCQSPDQPLAFKSLCHFDTATLYLQSWILSWLVLTLLDCIVMSRLTATELFKGETNVARLVFG